MRNYIWFRIWFGCCVILWGSGSLYGSRNLETIGIVLDGGGSGEPSSYEIVATTELDDDFSAASLDTDKWTERFVNIGAGETATITQSGGLLNINLVSVGTGYNHAYVHTFGKYGLRGDFDIQVDFDLANFPSANNSYAYLELVNYVSPVTKPTEEARVVLQYRSGTREYGGEIRHNGSPDPLEGTGTYSSTSDTSGKFRVTRVGTTANTYYWNGSGWTLLESGTIGTNDMAVVLWVSSTGPEPSVNFDNLVVNSADAVLHYL